jgi:hypothetical protein
MHAARTGRGQCFGPPRRRASLTLTVSLLRRARRLFFSGVTMAKLKDQFSDKQWSKCCGKGCKKCEIHNAYLAEFGKKEGEKRFQKDHDKMH